MPGKFRGAPFPAESIVQHFLSFLQSCVVRGTQSSGFLSSGQAASGRVCVLFSSIGAVSQVFKDGPNCINSSLSYLQIRGPWYTLIKTENQLLKKLSVIFSSFVP